MFYPSSFQHFPMNKGINEWWNIIVARAWSQVSFVTVLSSSTLLNSESTRVSPKETYTLYIITRRPCYSKTFRDVPGSTSAHLHVKRVCHDEESFFSRKEKILKYVNDIVSHLYPVRDVFQYLGFEFLFFFCSLWVNAFCMLTFFRWILQQIIYTLIWHVFKS